MTALVVCGILVGLGAGRVLWRTPHGAAQAMGGHDASHGGATVLKTLYTCGMHPEVIEEEKSTCPKCGMNLTRMAPDRARMILEARGEAVPDAAAKGERKVRYWRAPMDPTYIRNEPGKSPMGMDLVPVYEDEVSGGPQITIDPVTEQNMGLRYDIVRIGPLEKTLRTLGVVDYDERSLGTVSTKIDGWVEKVYVDQTGAQVHKGDALFELYSPELYSAQEEYFVALQDLESARARGAEQAIAMALSRVDSSRGRLLLYDISEDQIDTIEKTRKIQKTMTIESMLTGIVTEKNIVEGDYLKAGMPAYKTADLSTVWVIGKVFESDLPFVKLGQEARMKLDYLPGREYKGRVTYIYPYLEKGTREASVRMEFHNPGYLLKPGMYATIEIKSRILDEAVLTPDISIIDTGARKVAYVMREPGKFELRQLTVGPRTGANKIQVLSGLAPGDKVVVSGQFLLDSESRLREATLKMLNPGLTNTEQTAPSQSAAGDDGPPDGLSPALREKYVCPMPSHAGILYDEPGDCPLCQMRLVAAHAHEQRQSPVDHYTCPMPEHYDVSEEASGKCPKCGMTLIPVTEEEVQRFQQIDPEDLPAQLYTCPMPSDADVVSDQEGECPKCGMTLVPTASVPHGDQALEYWRQSHPVSEAEAASKESAASKN